MQGDPPRRAGLGDAAARWAEHPIAARCLLVAVTFAVWWPTLRCGFVWDDFQVIVDSDRLRTWSALIEVFRQPATWSTGFEAYNAFTYRPLALASFVVDYKLYGGLNPWGYHLTSVLLHAGVALAVHAFLRAWTTPVTALALALVFAVHPTGLEAVAWINGRSEVFALGFGALALAWTARADAPRPARTAAVTLALLAAMLGKETGATFVVLTLLVAAVHPRTGTTTGRRSHVAHAAGACAIAVVAYASLRAQALAGLVGDTRDLGGFAFDGVLFGYARFIEATIAPIDVAPVTIAHWIRGLDAAGRAVGITSVVAGVLALAALAATRRTRAAIGLMWWGGALVPVAVLVGSDWPGMARWVYVALPGFLATVAVLIDAAPRPRRAAAVVLPFVALYGALTFSGIRHWTSDLTLFHRATVEAPDDPFVWRTLGDAYYQIGLYDEADDAWREALERGSYHPTLPWGFVLTATARGECPRIPGLYALATDLAGAYVPDGLDAAIAARCPGLPIPRPAEPR